MSPSPHTIDTALRLFASERTPELRENDARLYRYVLFLLELCINNYGHRNLDPDERAFFERAYHRERKDFFELFGPEKLLPELSFFCSKYLDGDVLTSERVRKRAPMVVKELTSWLLDHGLVAREIYARERLREAARRRLRFRVGHLVGSLAPSVISVDPDGLESENFVAHDHHLVAQLAPRRLWLTVFPGGVPLRIGPILVPVSVSSGLRPSWTIAGSLGRVRGRWRFVDVVGIYPRV